MWIISRIFYVRFPDHHWSQVTETTKIKPWPFNRSCFLATRRVSSPHLLALQHSHLCSCRSRPVSVLFSSTFTQPEAILQETQVQDALKQQNPLLSPKPKKKLSSLHSCHHHHTADHWNNLCCFILLAPNSKANWRLLEGENQLYCYLSPSTPWV